MEKLQGFDQNLAPQDLQIQLTKTESCILVFFWVFFFNFSSFSWAFLSQKCIYESHIGAK